MARVVLQQTPSGSSKSIMFISQQGCLWNILWVLAVILPYFALSIGLTFYQRWFVQKSHYPLITVLCHLIIKFVVAAFFRFLYEFWSKRRRVRISWPNNVRKVAPVGFVGGLDIAFSNWGLEFVTISIYTLTKSTCIIFILFFSLMFKLEKKSWSLFVIVAMISGGLAMFTYKADQFDLLGFLLVLFASFASGLRWTLAQFVMQRSDLGLSHPLDMLYYLQLWMLIPLIPLVIAFEAGVMMHSYSQLVFPQDWPEVGHQALLVLCGAVIALAMELAEYLVVSKMSSLTLSIAGVFKEVVTLTLAVVINGDRISLVNGAGLLMCLGGIICHVIHKAALVKKHGASSASHLLGSGPGDGSSQHKPLLLDDAAAHFLADGTTSTDEEDDLRDDSSTEVLFSVLNSRDR